MSLFSGLVGIGKIASNFLGGGAGDSQNTKGSQTANQTQNQVSTTTQTGQNTQSSSAASNASQSNNQRQFSDNFLQVLELVAKDSLGSTAQGSDALRGRLSEVSANPIKFDSDAFVKGVMTAATDSVNNQLASDVNGIVSATGGSVAGNSASALLANRKEVEARASLAGVNASANAQAAEIQSNLDQSKTSQISGLTQGLDATLTSLLSALKGGESQQDITGKQTEASNQAANSTQSGTQNGTTTSTGQTLSSSNTVQPFNWQKGFGNIFNIDTDK